MHFVWSDQYKFLQKHTLFSMLTNILAKKPLLLLSLQSIRLLDCTEKQPRKLTVRILMLARGPSLAARQTITCTPYQHCEHLCLTFCKQHQLFPCNVNRCLERSRVVTGVLLARSKSYAMLSYSRVMAGNSNIVCTFKGQKKGVFTIKTMHV